MLDNAGEVFAKVSSPADLLAAFHTRMQGAGIVPERLDKKLRRARGWAAGILSKRKRLSGIDTFVIASALDLNFVLSVSPELVAKQSHLWVKRRKRKPAKSLVKRRSISKDEMTPCFLRWRAKRAAQARWMRFYQNGAHSPAH